MTLFFDTFADIGEIAPDTYVQDLEETVSSDMAELSEAFDALMDATDSNEADTAGEWLDDGILVDSFYEDITAEEIEDGASQNDSVQPSPVLFRATDVTILSPELCLRLGSDAECTIDTRLVNEALKASLQDSANPYNLLFSFDSLDFGHDHIALLIGDGECNFEGAPPKPVACNLGEQYCQLDAYGVDCPRGSVLLECFEAQTDRLEFYLKDIFLSLLSVQIRGEVRTKYPYKMNAEIFGFLPQNTAKVTYITIGGGIVVTLFDFLRDVDPDEYDGIVGYWFRVGVRASHVSAL